MLDGVDFGLISFIEGAFDVMRLPFHLPNQFCPSSGCPLSGKLTVAEVIIIELFDYLKN